MENINLLYNLNYRYESSHQKSQAPNLPVLGGSDGAGNANISFGQEISSTAARHEMMDPQSVERENLERQHTTSSFAERRSHPTARSADAEEIAGSGIEELMT